MKKVFEGSLAINYPDVEMKNLLVVATPLVLLTLEGNILRRS